MSWRAEGVCLGVDEKECGVCGVWCVYDGRGSGVWFGLRVWCAWCVACCVHVVA